ncbi:hypothetical protein BTJ68_02456 [Hortaea werneckii EXF-2000]|uniref:3-beta hydroxysteroid dehydrogenase/isomerase domain-containing protein n=1 Tax=Hortaea werneckii EXF-2000 TaxID=1157616 RepID=A0A1Z5TPG2_HORWE|nr:hypothetical protein BTJ68_02456 [Hortaea werneckii EXF-2000]
MATKKSFKKNEQIKSLGRVAVTGGCGFLGGHIVSLLAERDVCDKTIAIDIKGPANPVEGVQYETTDITNYDAVLSLFENLKLDAVIHTASPPALNHKNHELFYNVNVNGTKNLVRAAQETGVKAFVYTSSASVIHDTVSDLVNADESYPLIMGANQPEYYTTTKAQAELHVLSSNRAPRTPNSLPPPSGPPPYPQRRARAPPGLAALLATSDRDAEGKALPLDTEKVDGEAFFITNDSPVYFFDFARMCWAAAGDRTRPEQVWQLSKDVGLLIATLMEWIFWLFRLGQPNLTRQQVKYTCMTRFYSIDKAKRRLGYRPVVGLQEGIKKGVHDALYRGVVKGQPEEFKGNREAIAKKLQ